MQVINYFNFSFLNSIVEKHAKYQKVAVIYDVSTTNTELDEIYRTIKNNCIYNKFSVEENLDEVYNGYKLLIFVCTANSFLQLDIRLNEFTCVFLPTDESMLPYYLNNFKLESENNYLCLKQGVADGGVLPSVYFNKLFNYVNELVYNETTNIDLNFSYTEVTQLALKNILNGLDNSLLFEDIKIIKKTNLDYNNLPLLDYVLACALTCFIKAVKSQTLNLVDVYKSVGENYELLNQYYAMINNDLLVSIVRLNSNSLYLIATKTRQKILEHLTGFSKEEVENVINCIKQFAKTDKGLLGHLYLYNVFEV